MKRLFLIIVLLFPSICHADITTSLEAWWKFDEGSGTTAADSTVNGHTGTLNGTATWNSPGKIGASSVSYPGTSGNGTSFSTITAGTTFTYAAWIYRPTGSVGAFENLIANSSAIGFWMTSDDKVDFDAGGVHKNNTALTRDTWHHFAAVDNATSVTFYLDGVADGTATVATSMFFNGMGCDSGTGGECFKGYNDDVRYYTRALSGADIAELYAYPPSGGVISKINGVTFAGTSKINGVAIGSVKKYNGVAAQ